MSDRRIRKWAAENERPRPVTPPAVSTSGECAYCGRPTKRFVLNQWACSWCSDLPGKEAL